MRKGIYNHDLVFSWPNKREGMKRDLMLFRSTLDTPKDVVRPLHSVPGDCRMRVYMVLLICSVLQLIIHSCILSKDCTLLNFFIAGLRCAKRVNWWCLPKDGWTMTYAVKWMAWYTIHMMEVGGYKKPLVLSVAPISWHPFPYGGPSWFPPVPQLRFPSPIHPGFSTTGLGKKLIPFLTCSTI